MKGPFKKGLEKIQKRKTSSLLTMNLSRFVLEPNACALGPDHSFWGEKNAPFQKGV